ncbi:zinc-ribbon domain-containing protein [Algisphaera agarilytica]|uniref:Zinc-ribbon domain-containing protein n=1 Tax=Algisphaera agarilytica TaxID=1385975 RepID=A0A7X0LLD9_9BACT|nr:zinc-ribbon domain-containing protein [Algisphaera agarilytica]MBB6430531.1 hypothetical protein [Algisphaera agarilytica]
MSDERFDCPNCGKAYRWQTKIAGKKVKCACGQKFRVPMMPGGDAEPEGPLVGAGDSPVIEVVESSPTEKPKPQAPEPNPYELDLPGDEPHGETAPISARSSEGAAAKGGKCPSCNTQLRPGAVICMNCGFNLAEGAKVQTVVESAPAEDQTPAAGRGSDATVGGVAAAVGEERVIARTRLQEDLAADMEKRHHFQEKTLPLIFLGIGAVLLLLNAFVLTPMLGDVLSLPMSVGESVGALIVYVILFAIQLPCLFIGILVISKLFGSAFGELFSALKKLAALALLAGQFDVMVDLGFDIMLGGLGFLAFWLKMALSFGVFWGLSKQMFDELEPTETIVLWIAMLFLPGFILLGVLFLLGASL